MNEYIYVYTYIYMYIYFFDGVKVSMHMSSVVSVTVQVTLVTVRASDSSSLWEHLPAQENRFFFSAPPSLSCTLSFLFVAYHTPCLARRHVWAPRACMCALFGGREVCCCVRFSPDCVHTTEF